MKSLKKIPSLTSLYIYIVFSIISFCFFSCGGDSGLGEEVDLTPPVLTVKSMTSEESDTITNFAGGVYCHKSVSFAGTATDNNRIAKVYTQIKWASDSSEFTDFETASLSGADWNLRFTFEKEGVVLLKFIATDPAGNVASKSTKTIILFVDEEAPVGSAWFIDRKINGIQYKLHELDYLKSLDLNESSHIDAAQNVNFSISAAFTDTMGISEENPPSISLYDESGNKICTVEKTGDSNVYQPVFDITHDLLVSGDASLATGKHYLQVRYSASDIVSVPDSNSIADAKIDVQNEDDEVDGGWFIWWPESDVPRYELSEEITEADTGEKSITVYVNSSFSITVFDDDALALSDDESTTAPVGYIFSYTDDKEETQTASETPSINEGEREKTLTVKLPSTPQTATLKITAQGKKGDTDGGKTLEETVLVNVIDATAPMLLITSPKNNSVPEVAVSDDNATAFVTISGTSLDVAGCKYLEFVWVPDSIASSTAEKSTKAKAFLDTLTTDTLHDTYAPTSTTAKKTEIESVGVLWSVPLTSRSVSGGFISHKFEFDIDLFTDFASENKKATDKFFVARLTRSGTTGTYSEYKLAGDSSNPTISAIRPEGDMAIVSGEEALVLEFKGFKDSGMKMDTTAYEIRRVDEKADDGLFGTYDSEKNYATVSGSYDSESGTYKSEPILPGSGNALYEWKNAGTKPKFQFIAKDLLGNVGIDQYTIVVSTLPVLKSVTSPSATLLKKGDELLINAVFDNTVTMGDTSNLYVKLEGFSDNQIHEATYKSGNGSTTLIFSYTVQDGDTSSQVKVKNDEGSPIVGLSEKIATLLKSDNATSIVESTNLLQAKKTIAVDGIPPVATISSITSDISSLEVANYQNGGITYLKEGRTLSVTLTASEAILISGSPEFAFAVGSGTITLPFTGSTSTTVTFSKKIESTDANGELTYSPSSCVSASSTITDSAGNPITLPTGEAVSASFAVDTKAPATPTVVVDTTSSNYSGTINKVDYFANSASFTATVASSDSSVKSVEYSPNGGTAWFTTTSGTAVTLSATEYSSVQLVCRATDYAGNVSALSEAQNLQINSTFPAFTLECTNADGNYPAGSMLIFKLSFDEKVNYSSSAICTADKLANGSCAYIQLSALNSGEKCGDGANKGRAYLSDKSGTPLTSASSSETDTVYFTYQAQDPDEFTLKVASDAVHLTGFTDLYGISQGSNGLDGDYERSGVVCDGVAPKVVSMTPGGTKTSASDGKNVYTEGNTITLVFSEQIQKSGGNITLRQVSGWAIPPVLSASDFSTISSAISSDQKNTLSLQENGIDMEDSEWTGGSVVGPANNYYHGTGQYVGPYKKSSQGILDTGAPDTATKYVLDFDMDIWDTNTTTHYFGKTFNANSTSATVLTGSKKRDAKAITVQDIRDVLETAHYHERILDVTADAVKIESDNKTVTITFPAGLCDTSANLPSGRRWELVIEKGAFMDMTGNEFGANSVGVVEKIDSVHSNGTQIDTGISTSNWGRYKSSSTTPVVLIQNGSNYYFWSSGVATPVIRVDRYSYGLGINQSNASGTVESQITSHSVKPTGYVRTRIDCESLGATVAKYVTTDSDIVPESTSVNTTTSNTQKTTSIAYQTKSTLSGKAVSGISTIAANSPIQFAVGTGSYTKAFKKYVVAQATLNGSSEKGYEGVFQTVVMLDHPQKNDGKTAVATLTGNQFSLRGNTGSSLAGEPSISPFPLRECQVGSPFLRLTFNDRAGGNTNSDDYYWVSYEVLVDTTFSGYCSSGTATAYDWTNPGSNNSHMACGQFTYYYGMQRY